MYMYVHIHIHIYMHILEPFGHCAANRWPQIPKPTWAPRPNLAPHCPNLYVPNFSQLGPTYHQLAYILKPR